MMRFRKRWLAKINIAFTNRITSLFAGWLPGFGILTHIGRKSADRVISAVPSIQERRPDPRYISTSHIERSNLTLRMQLRRFTGLTNAHSRKLENLKHTIALYMAW